MKLLIVGINHNSAPMALRERVAFTPERIPDALESMLADAKLPEAAILSTCNRTEIIAVAESEAREAILHWLTNYQQLDRNDLVAGLYVKTGEEALRHAIRVAAGLDSMILGEPQILGQFKASFETAKRLGTLGSELGHLADTALRIARKVRNETVIGESSVSVASTAVTLARQVFSNPGDCRALLVGAGDTSRLVAEHLHSSGVKHMVIANRTPGAAIDLARRFNGEAAGLQTLPQRLPDADIVIASTAARLPILGKGMVERALKARRHKPILMVDLAVPRNIEPEVAGLRNIYLYSVDDLQSTVRENLSSRAHAAATAEKILRREVAGFRSREEIRSTNQAIKQFRKLHDELKEQELAKVLERLGKGEDPEQLLTDLANRLTNKIIHNPTVTIRRAIDADDSRLVNTIKEIYKLPPE